MSIRLQRAILVQLSKLLRRLTRKLPNMGEADMIELRSRARDLRSALDHVIRQVNLRVSPTKNRPAGFQKPADADWAWRPELWTSAIAHVGVASARSKTRLGDEARLFHDCEISDLTIKQFRNLRSIDLAPFGFMMDVFHFGGSYLSLAISLPIKRAKEMTTGHIIELEAIFESERPLKTLASLNIKHGPNVEQIIREFSQADKLCSVGFDLGYLMLNENRIKEVWLDLIFEAPQMNQIKIRDLTFYRRPRAEF